MSDLLSTLHSHRRAILSRDAQTERYLAALYRATVERPVAHEAEQLANALSEWRKAHPDEKHGTPSSWLYDGDRLHRMQMLVSGQADSYSADAQRLIEQQAGQATQSGATDGLALLESVKPRGVHHTWARPSEHALAALRESAKRHHLFASWGRRAADQATRLLFADLALGRNPRSVARDLLNLLAQLTYSRALVIARTSMLRAYNDAALATYRANNDVCDGWVWVADLSVNTCGACLAMNGSVHSLDEELDDHPNGRCAKAPLTKGWGDILGPLGIDTSGIPDTRPTFTSGADWFDALSDDQQRSILGPGKYDAFSSGDFSLDDLIGIADDPLWGRSIYELPLRRLRKK